MNKPVVLPSEAAQHLATHLESETNNFLFKEWIGNPYTGVGSEYPIIDRDLLAKIIQEYWDNLM